MAFGLCLVVTVGVGWAVSSRCDAAPWRAEFQTELPTWAVYAPDERVQVLRHHRDGRGSVNGTRAERLVFSLAEGEATVILEHRVPAATLLEDFSATVRMNVNRPGAQVALRVVFPDAPAAPGEPPLTQIFSGDRYPREDRWSAVTCVATEQKLLDARLQWRAQLPPDARSDHRQYVDRVLVIVPLSRGKTEIMIDEVTVNPLIPYVDAVADSQPALVPQTDFVMDRLRVDNRPFFPIVGRHTGETPEELHALGFNTVWVNDFRDASLRQNLFALGLWSTATPPSIKGEDGRILPASAASLVPFDRSFDDILFWSLGNRLTADDRDTVLTWSDQVRAADRRRRPMAADVKGNELLFSRDLNMVGTSRHVLHTDTTLGEYLREIRLRTEQAEPGTFMMTTLQCEPSPTLNHGRAEMGAAALTVEPEQLRQQVYAALGAGVRGLCYWTTTPLRESDPTTRERALAVQLLNAEVRLLEPFLATATFHARIAGRVRSGGNDGATTLASFSASAARTEAPVDPDRGPWASVFRTDHGWLILPMWLDPFDQYVPGPGVGKNVTFVVDNLPEATFAWEVSTTGVRPVPTRRVSGGVELSLERLDQTSILIASSDIALEKILEERVRGIRDAAATKQIELAAAKLARVEQVEAELASLGMASHNQAGLLAAARDQIQRGRSFADRGEPPAAAFAASQAAEFLRRAQRQSWQQAVISRSNVTASDHTLCYSTLPDYWRLMARLATYETVSVSAGWLSGAFEVTDGPARDGWLQSVTPVKSVLPRVELATTAARGGRYGLRISAGQLEGEEPPAIWPGPAIKLLSPAVAVERGDVVHVSLWVRIPRNLAGTHEGFRVYDNAYGPVSGERLTEACDWRQLEWIREMPAAGQWRFCFELGALGQVFVDDVNVQILRPPLTLDGPAPESELPSVSPEVGPAPREGGGPLEFLDRFPTLWPAPGREAAPRGE